MSPVVPSQPKEGDIPQASIPLAQEELASPSVPKKHKKRIKIWMKKKQRIKRRLVPSPSIPKTIPKRDEEEKEEEELEEEEEQVPLQGRTQLERAIELETRKSATGIGPST